MLIEVLRLSIVITGTQVSMLLQVITVSTVIAVTHGKYS